MANPMALLLSCEHGGNQVPEPYRPLFADHTDLLQTHRGYDLGILPLAMQLARDLDVPLMAAEVTRLLVDLNRSVWHPALFSFITRELPAGERKEILRSHYHPYRQALEERVTHLIETGKQVVHIAVHSFTPELHGQIRTADVGLLYDPARLPEKTFCLHWQRTLSTLDPQLRVRRNYPYRGAADSLGKSLRRRFGANDYLAIELEVNQRIPSKNGDRWQWISDALSRSLSNTLSWDLHTE